MSNRNNKALDQKKSSNRTIILILALAVITGIAYSNSFSGVFLFDDGLAIVDNLRIRSISPPLKLFTALPPGPVITVTLALDGDHLSAEKYYWETLRLDPGRADANYNLALLLRERGDEKGSRAYLLNTLRIDPEFKGARAALERIEVGTINVMKE